jgi:GntR family transcriptional regulator, carbon starvation induced regulator
MSKRDHFIVPPKTHSRKAPVLVDGLAANGAISITSAPREESEAPNTSFETLRNIREDIVAGVFEPGERLKFEDLKERYAASVGTLRESLLHLLSEGFVRSEANRGFTVAPVSVADLADITRLRVQFEIQALEDAIRHGDDHWEAEIVTSLHLLMKLIVDGARPTRSPDWPARHRRFHYSLVAACRSPWLLHFRGTLFDQAERYRSLGRMYRKSPRDVGQEHQALADAVLSRNVARACELGERHIRSTVDNVISNVPGLRSGRKPRD